MGANEEIGQDAATRPARFSVLSENLGGEKKRFPRHRLDAKTGLGKHLVEIFDPVVAHGYLGVDDIIDTQWAEKARGVELRE